MVTARVRVDNANGCYNVARNGPDRHPHRRQCLRVLRACSGLVPADATTSPAMARADTRIAANASTPSLPPVLALSLPADAPDDDTGAAIVVTVCGRKGRAVLVKVLGPDPALCSLLSAAH